MEIDLLKLRAITLRILDHLIHHHKITKISLDQNFYWDIAPDGLYNLSAEPRDMHVGSLFDDWEFIAKTLEPEYGPIVYQLTELAPILRYIGETVGIKLGEEGG